MADETYLSFEETRRLLKMTENELLSAAVNGEIRAIKDGGEMKFLETDVQDLAEQRATDPTSVMPGEAGETTDTPAPESDDLDLAPSEEFAPSNGETVQVPPVNETPTDDEIVFEDEDEASVGPAPSQPGTDEIKTEEIVFDDSDMSLNEADSPQTQPLDLPDDGMGTDDTVTLVDDEEDSAGTQVLLSEDDQEPQATVEYDLDEDDDDYGAGDEGGVVTSEATMARRRAKLEMAEPSSSVVSTLMLGVCLAIALLTAGMFVSMFQGVSSGEGNSRNIVTPLGTLPEVGSPYLSGIYRQIVGLGGSGSPPTSEAAPGEWNSYFQQSSPTFYSLWGNRSGGGAEAAPTGAEDDIGKVPEGEQPPDAAPEAPGESPAPGGPGGGAPMEEEG